MNRARILAVVAGALLLALIASVGAYKYLSEKGRVAEEARLQTVGILAAVVDIPLGSTLNSNQVAISAWPKDLYPKDALIDVKAAVGRVAIRDFRRGEPIVESKLVPANRVTGLLPLKVAAGLRAFSVKVDEVVGVGGFIVPDSRVDVVATTSPSPQRQQEKVSKIILENVQVLATGQTIEQKENKPVTVNTVTLAVTPEDAEKLALASNDGKIQLVLRNFADSETVMTGGIDKGRLLASYRHGPPVTANPGEGKSVKRVVRKAPAAPARTKYTVDVIKGSKRSEESVE